MTVANTFEKGPEGWCSYEYHASVVAGHNYFVLTTWDEHGGSDESGCVWADHTHWSTDAPERPVSILPLILYRNWVGEPSIDLRGAQLSVQLRGDDLKLAGAECYFWAHTAGTRWHCSGRPVEIAEGRWDEPSRLILESDESVWYRSWVRPSFTAANLDEVLSSTTSYGFSLVGFAAEPVGKLSMSSFDIRSA
jgi:hypothetical protein